MIEILMPGHQVFKPGIMPCWWQVLLIKIEARMADWKVKRLMPYGYTVILMLPSCNWTKFP